jgi:WD repeat-containing protein 23
LLGNRSRNRDDDDDEDLQDGYGGLGRRRRRKSKAVENKFPEVPSKEGQELMNSGIYGSDDHFVDSRKKRKTSLGARLMYREMGIDTRGTLNRANMLMSQVCESSGTYSIELTIIST